MRKNRKRSLAKLARRKRLIKLYESVMSSSYARLFVITFLVCLIATPILITVINESEPEAEEVTTTACTSAPDINIVPEPKETIHNNEAEIPSEAPGEPTTDDNISVVDQDELEMLACVIYQEAGGDAQCDDCRRRVADVVLNRVNSTYFPDTIYEVLTQKSQYGRLHWTGVVWPERSTYESEQAAVERAYRIAEDVLTGHHSSLYDQGYIWQAEF